MLTLRVETSGAQARLNAVPQAVRAALARKMASLAQALADHIVDEELSGQLLQAKTGALRASIAAKVTSEGRRITAQVGSFGGVKYAAIQEFGGKTSAHDILPDKAKALAFVAQGATVFARLAHHPGSEIPARFYLGAALAAMQSQIVADLAEAATEGARIP